MRVNVYGEELTDEVEIVHKAVDQKSFYGVRFYLKSHPDLHHGIQDNDRSAVTLWVPYTKLDRNKFDVLKDILQQGVDLLQSKMSEEGWNEKKPA